MLRGEMTASNLNKMRTAGLLKQMEISGSKEKTILHVYTQN